MDADIKDLAGKITDPRRWLRAHLEALPPLVRERVQMAHSFGIPELSRAFEAALLLSAGGFDGAEADRPAPAVQGAVVHPACVGGKVVLLARHHLARLSREGF